MFSTKNREATLTEAHSEELYKYIWGIISERDCKLYRIGGIEDHIHIFSDLHPSISLAGYVKDIKQGSGQVDEGKWRVPEVQWVAPIFGSYGAFMNNIKEKQTPMNTYKTKKNITRQ